jgi:hypothetical protein
MKFQGATGMGFTALDDLNLVMDIVQMAGDSSDLEALGMTVTMPGGPVNLDFADTIPADAQLAVLSNQPGPKALVVMDNVRAMGDYMQETQLLSRLSEREMGRQAAQMMDRFNLGDLITFGEFGFAGMTGLNLQDDVLAWMDGDCAAYLRLMPAETLPVTVDMAAVIATSDPDATQAMIDQLAAAFDKYRISYMREGNGPRDVLALDEIVDQMLPPDMPFNAEDAAELDILLGTNGTAFVAGTRPGVQYSLNPDGPGLGAAPSFVNAATYFLPDAEVVLYADLKPLFPVVLELAETMRASEWEMRELNDMIRVASVLDSASISGLQTDDAHVARFVLSLSEEAPAVDFGSEAGSGSG